MFNDLLFLSINFLCSFSDEHPGMTVGPVKVEFGMNLLPYKLAHRAVTIAGKNPQVQFERLLFPVLSTFEPLLNPQELQLRCADWIYNQISLHDCSIN